MAGIRPGEGDRKPGSVCDLQSAFREHLARIEETVAGTGRQGTWQYRSAKPIFYSAIRLGEKVRIGRKEAHLIGGPPKSAWPGVGKRRRRKCHPGTAAPSLG